MCYNNYEFHESRFFRKSLSFFFIFFKRVIYEICSGHRRKSLVEKYTCLKKPNRFQMCAICWKKQKRIAMKNACNLGFLLYAPFSLLNIFLSFKFQIAFFVSCMWIFVSHLLLVLKLLEKDVDSIFKMHFRKFARMNRFDKFSECDKRNKIKLEVASLSTQIESNLQTICHLFEPMCNFFLPFFLDRVKCVTL